jgi:hypothetical protein
VDNLNRIQTKNLAITAAPKMASTNLAQFFVDRLDNIIETISYRKLPNIIIVITRNERDRWCSGVIQEINELELGHQSKHSRVSYILDKEADSLGQKSIFTNSHAHLGTIGYLTCITELVLRDNTYFTDISSLSKKSFWKTVCELDNTWPNLNEWWDDWNNFRNGDHGPPVSVNPEQIQRKKLVSIVKDMLNNDTRLDFISTILDNNQETINYLKKTDKWI